MTKVPLVRWKEAGLMQDGNPVPDPVCGRCKKKIDIEGRKEGVYNEGLWCHPPCHGEGADQLFGATQLADVLKEARRGVEIVQSPLLQGDDPPALPVD